MRYFRPSATDWGIQMTIKYYEVRWSKGRKIGAIGIFYPDSVSVTAYTPEDALRKAYETHEHLMFVTVTETNVGCA